MRVMNAVLVVAVVLAIGGSAYAVTFNQPYMGDLKFKFSNYDSGRIYVGPDGVYTPDAGPSGNGGIITLTDLKDTPWTAGQTYGSVAAPGAVQGEDGWGLFELTTIMGKSDTGQYNIVLWEKGGVGDTRPDIVGMFYGLVDQQVTLTTRTDGLVEQEIWAAGDDFRVDFYEVPNGTALLSGPEARTAINQFPLWTVGDPILTGNGLADQFVTPIPPTSGLKYWSKTVMNPNTGSVVPRSSAEGSAKLFVEWYGGTDYGQFSIPGADLEFTTHVYGNETIFDWTTNTDDPAFGGAVPEPATMLAGLLTVGALGGYLRRRKLKM